MARDPQPFAVVAEANAPSEFTDRLKSGAFLWGLAGAIVLAGFLWLGRAGMTDPKSPDFFPLPHLFAFVSALVGTLFLVIGTLHRIRHGKFGSSILEATPAEVGGVFQCRIRTTGGDVVSTGPFVANLRCDNRSETTGTSNQGVRTALLWEARQELPAGTRSSLGLPFTFAIPATALRSGNRSRRKSGVHPEGPDQIEWTLSVTAPTRGVNYAVTFPIEVHAGPGAQRAPPTRNRPPPAVQREETRLQRLGLGVLSLGTLVLGGRVPDADERRELRGAAARAGGDDEPPVAFAGEIQPEQGSVRLMRRALIGFGLLFALGGLWGLVQQVRYDASAERFTAQITAVDAPVAGLALRLETGEAGRVASVTRFHSWTVGQAVDVDCSRTTASPRRCQMNSGFDRFLGGLGASVVGLGFLLVAWMLRYRPRLYPTAPGGAR